MATPIKLYVPRIYLDANILISAILESDPQWKQKHAKAFQIKKEQIESSRKIFLGWEHRMGHLNTSTFAIGEFIGRGSKQFNKPFKEMLSIVEQEILPRCKLFKAENLRYDKNLIPEKIQKGLLLVEIVGKAQVGTEFHYGLTMGMAEVRMITGGRETTKVDMKDLVMGKIRAYRAPGFEIMLFQKVSEMANKYRLSLADAFHLFYARGNVEYLITNDKEFLSRWERNPKVEKETHMKAIGSVEFLELSRRRRYLS